MTAGARTLPPHRRRDTEPRNPAAMIVVVALHLAALWALMQVESVRSAVTEAVPIMVGLITPPVPEKVEPPPPPPPKVEPKPKPKMIVTEGPPVPEAITVPEEPEPVEEVAMPPAPAEIAPPPAPVIPPSFAAAYLSNPPPEYPSTSKRLQEQGRVLLRVLVSREGRALSVDIEKSSGYERLDRAALDAVRRWKFVPAKQGDEPIEAPVLVPLDFALSAG
ncbi:MAG TPA: energy transducer TonB [Nevskiaceae bacterium]|nr:energy transducer TonB [Nevskiaceae bacterium]